MFCINLFTDVLLIITKNENSLTAEITHGFMIPHLLKWCLQKL